MKQRVLTTSDRDRLLLTRCKLLLEEAIERSDKLAAEGTPRGEIMQSQYDRAVALVRDIKAALETKSPGEAVA